MEGTKKQKQVEETKKKPSEERSRVSPSLIGLHISCCVSWCTVVCFCKSHAKFENKPIETRELNYGCVITCHLYWGERNQKTQDTQTEAPEEQQQRRGWDGTFCHGQTSGWERTEVPKGWRAVSGLWLWKLLTAPVRGGLIWQCEGLCFSSSEDQDHVQDS